MEKLNEVKRIESEFNENKNSHIFLIETNNMDNSLKDIKELIKKRINADEITKIQIDNETYIELIILNKENENISKDAILSLQERIKTKPILSNYIFYIILNAEKMSDISSNKLLKTLEEPAENVIGFILTSNLDMILPTIKSRSEITRFYYLVEEEKNDFELYDIAVTLAELFEKGNLLELNLYKKGDKKIEQTIKENIKIIIQTICDIYSMASNVKKIDTKFEEIVKKIRQNNSLNTIIQVSTYLNSSINKLSINMNADLLLEKIFMDMREVKKNADSGNKI